MTGQQLNNIIDKQIAECQSVLKSKGNDYSSDKDRLENFKVVAQILEVPPSQVWAVYWMKHVIAIAKWATRGSVESEPIEGRFTDCINYLLLGRGIVEEPAEPKQLVFTFTDPETEDTVGPFKVEPRQMDLHNSIVGYLKAEKFPEPSGEFDNYLDKFDEINHAGDCVCAQCFWPGEEPIF